MYCASILPWIIHGGGGSWFFFDVLVSCFGLAVGEWGWGMIFWRANAYFLPRLSRGAMVLSFFDVPIS